MGKVHWGVKMTELRVPGLAALVFIRSVSPGKAAYGSLSVSFRLACLCLHTIYTGNTYGVSPPPPTFGVCPLWQGCRTERTRLILESNMVAVDICGRVGGNSDLRVLVFKRSLKSEILYTCIVFIVFCP